VWRDWFHRGGTSIGSLDAPSKRLRSDSPISFGYRAGSPEMCGCGAPRVRYSPGSSPPSGSIVGE
jgi:hypothetical protein